MKHNALPLLLSRIRSRSRRKVRQMRLEQLEARRVLAAALFDSTPQVVAPQYSQPAWGEESTWWGTAEQQDAFVPASELARPVSSLAGEGEGGGGNGGGSGGDATSVFYYSPSVSGFVKNSNHSKLFVDDSDVVKLSVFSNNSWKHEIYFDGSDVGLSSHGENIDAFAIRPDGSLLFSTTGDANVPGVKAEPEDLLRFIPTKLDSHTSGSWQLFLDGSDVGLSSWEGLDGISELPDGRLIVSVQRTASLPGISSSVKSEDLVALTLTSTGKHSSGSWERYFDGSDVHLGGLLENVDGVSVDSDGTTVHLSTSSLFIVPGLLGFGRDIFTFEAEQLGSHTDGHYRTPLTLNGSHRGLLCNSINAIHIPSATVVNQPPIIAGITSPTIPELAPFQLQLSATDPDTPAAQIVWSLVSGPIGSELDAATGLYTWTPSEAQGPGVFPMIVAVSDGTSTVQATFSISVTEVNQPPVIEPIADRTIDEEAAFSLQVTANDTDLPAQSLTYAVGPGAPSGANISSTGVFSWTPGEVDGPGEFTVPVVVTDAFGASTTQNFTITVREVNRSPVLAPINDQTLDINQTLSINAVATDPDLPANTLSYSLTAAPPSATINAQTGEINWLADVSGAANFTVQVADQGGLTSSQSFQVNVIGVELRELDNFSTERVQVLTVPNETSSLRIAFETPNFDLSSQSDIRDAFEIELMDMSGNPLVLPYAGGVDASFNWTEGLTPVSAQGVMATIAGAGGVSAATINLSGLPTGTQFQLRLRLVNNDSDNGTLVRITDVSFVNESTDRPLGASLASNSTNLATVNFNTLQDVTGNFTVDYGRTTLAAENDRLLVHVQLQNESSQSYRGPVLMVVKNLSSLQVNALRPDGFTPAGDPYFQIELASEAISTGESSIARQVGFLNRSDERFDYEVQILASANSAPGNFSTSPLTSIEAGNLYSYTAQAVDPDGDTITYSIVTGPSTAVINPSTGQLTWNTTSEDLGSHEVTLVATDPYGLSVEQSFVIQVVESLQNRPPVFVSTPDTEAIAGSGFEVSTVQTGDNPIGVAVANIGLDDGTLVTINRGDQTLSQITALGNDLYELPLELTVGEPGPVDQILRSGYNIDVGLPRYIQQTEGNSIRGMDQADLNGDGLLDIVISAQVQQRIPATVYTQVINVVFGEGDGKFSEPVNLASIITNASSDPRTLRIADFDQDGKLDVLALNLRATATNPSPSLFLLRGAGDGSFSPVETMSIATVLNDFKTVDLNRDGVLDLIGATSDTRSLGYMLGIGDGTFAPFIPVVTSPNRIFYDFFPGRNYATSDMDADGDIDVVYTDYTTGTVNVVTNDGSLNFASAISLVAPRPFGGSGGANLYSVFVGDFNGDALVDIAYGADGYTSNNTGSLGMFIRDSSGFTFSYQDAVDSIAGHPGNWAGNSDPIDIDGDGDLDLVVGGVTTASNFGEFSSVLRNRGDGTFTANNISLPFTDNSDYEAINRENDTKGILAGDYNGDGMMDLVAFKSAHSFTGSVFSTVSVMLADRPGEYATNNILHFDYQVNAPQRFFEAGDFNNDGIVDLWSPKYQGVSRTWLGIGDGTFNDPIIATPYIGNEFLSKGFTGDFDKDGNLDVFWLGNGGVQNGPTSRLLAALGNGDGTFTRTFTLPYSHSEVFSADFNGDGYIDFASRNFGTALDVFLYDIENPGTWLLASTFAFSSLGTTAGDYRGTLTVDDFNGDGNLDLAAAYRLSVGEPQIAVLPGVGDGTFGSPISTAYSVNIPDYNSPAQFSSGDLNEDGIADLVSYDSLAVGVHLGIGDGTFGTATVIAANDPRQLYGNIFIKDFDYDGLQDILFTDTLGAAQLHFLRGRGDGTFEERISYDPAIPAGYVEFGDLDNDGRDEVILSDPNGINFATILYAARERLTDIVTADLNGDGNDDVLTTNFDNSRVKWFLGDNLGGLTKQTDLLTANGPVGLLVTDLNQDSTNEIITVNRSDRSVSIFSGDVTSYTRTDIPVGRTPIAVTAALVDTDSFQDLLVLDEALNSVWYLRGNNNTTFATPVPLVLGDRPNDILASDVNNDGFTDVVVSLPDSNRLMILPGDGTGNFAMPVYVALPGSPTAIGWSDFNQDGRTDLAVTIGELDQVAILYGRGQLQFASPQAILVGDQPASLQISDADGDGRDDIVVANAGDDTVSVIYNRFDPTQVYRYDALAIDPDNDTVSYELLNAPGGMILDADTGQITWAASAEQIGTQLVTIQASDGRGGLATQAFNIDVAPARENHEPLISTIPEVVVSADEAYTYLLRAVDADNNSLRYRLLDGPEGATIDPISGLVTWDAREAGQRTNQYTQVGQNFVVPATPALEPASVSAEGWFRFESLGAYETYIRKGDSFSLMMWNGKLRATVSSGSTDLFVEASWVRETGRWYNLAMTFDDSTKLLSILVDGEVVAARTADLTLSYSSADNVEIGAVATNFYKFNDEIGSVRIWNEALPQAVLQQSLSAEADAADPSLVLDLDFDATEAQTLRDRSSYQHVVYRTGSGRIYSQRTTGLAFSQTVPFVVSVEDGRSGYDQQSFDVTYLPPLKGSISGTLFDDQSDDGIQQIGEVGLADWLVYVDSNGNQYPDPSEPNAISDSNGRYAFNRLLPGNYPLRVQPRAGYETPTQSSANVVANQNSVVDFAIDQLALGQIRGQVTTTESDVAARWKVFADLDDNGVLNPSEPFTFTDDLGQFAIAGLDAGDYRVRAEMLPGWQVTDPSTRVLDVTLAANAIDAGNDFVITPGTTTASSGLQFVTTPNQSGSSDSVIAGVTYRYDALAIGLLGQDVRYDLSLAPDGMSIDVASGLVLWRPNLTQVGEQPVILRAMDSLGGVALQDFTLNVTAPNTAPVVTSTAPSLGYVGVESRYSIRAQDAENDTLTYSLVSGPSNATVDALSGKLTWTPSPTETGLNSFVVSVTDASGNVTLQPFDVTVSSATPTTTPFALSPIRTQAAINQAYRSQVIVHDAIGRGLPVSIVSGPVGLTMDSEGNVTWTPATSQLGSQALVVTADDGLGNSQQFTIDLNVTGRLINTAPQITSDPALFAVANQPYFYDVVAVDAENDQLAYQLLEAPVGMSINSATGTLRWLPNRELVGEHAISIQVTDAAGASTLQSYQLRVRAAGGPPQITSVPPTEAAVGTAWLYTVVATDVERDPLTYTLLTGPTGVVIDTVTGELSWTPGADQLGLNTIAIQVSDGSGGSTSQSFAIRVSAGVPNLPPTISTTPNRFGSVGSTYSYLPSATDPEAQSIAYSLRRGPATMTVNPTTGQLDWTPTASDVGKVVVTLVATDAGGAAAVQSFELDVLAANQTPTIVSSPSLSIAAGATWRYSVIGRDADQDPLRYEMLEAPAGATITVFGEVQWLTSVGDIGPHAFRFRVSDPRGGFIEQSFTLEVVADTVAPRVTVLPATIGSWPWDGPIHVYVSAVDNVGVASVTMTVNGIDVPLDANNHAALYVEDWGYAVLNIVATATDTAGNIGQGQGVTFYNDPEVEGDVNAPITVITSPSESASVTGFVAIEGTAAGSNFSNYRLLYRRADQPESSFVEFATSTTPMTDGLLGNWDTTLLNNDEYIIRLEVSNQSGRTNILDRQIGLSGELKLGNFQLTFTDMVIPVAGIPIEITRIYDTLQSDREGDFGYGWRLEYRNTDLRVGLPKSGLEDIGIYTPLRPGVKVFLNVPGEGRQGFTFNPEIRVLPGFGGNNLILARPRFTPDPGVTSTLGTRTSGFLQVNEQGELIAPGRIPYNPASPDFGGGYVLTTRDGITYRIDGASGKLDEASDRNGNTVKYSDVGVVSNSGVALTFYRDVAGRINRITDPNGNSVVYEFSNDLLKSTTDRLGNITTYVYDDLRVGYLKEVIDTLGRTGLRTEYDSDGRLHRQSEEINGGEVQFEQLLEDGRTLIRLADGSEQFLSYDSRGRVIEVVDELGNVTKRSFDANGLSVQVDALGNQTRYVRNSRGEILQQTNPDGSKEFFVYDARGLLAKATDALGKTTSFQYDTKGNLTQIDDNGSITRQLYDSSGKLIRRDLPSGDFESFVYSGQGFLAGQIVQGKETTFGRDSNGNETSQTTVAVKDGQTKQLTLTRTLDANGNSLSFVDSAGFVTTQEFDSNNNVVSIQTSDGKTVELDRDGQMLLRGVTFANGTTGTYTYNRRNFLVESRSPSGETVRYLYDAVGNNIAQIFSDNTPDTDDDNPRRTFQYDALRRVVAETNQSGETTTFTYNASGQVASQTNNAGEKVVFTYDAVGKLVQQVDHSGATTSFTYDGRGNVTETVFADGGIARATYDDGNRVVKTEDAVGSVTLFAYDNYGNLTRLVDANQNETRYEYDVFGNLTASIDGNGTRTDYGFDDRSLPTLIEYADGSTVQRTFRADSQIENEVGRDGRETDYRYDQHGRLVEIEYHDGSSEQYVYNSASRISEIVDINGTEQLEFDDRGRLVRFVSPNGEVTVYEYDALDRRTSVSTRGVRTEYVYDDAGRILSIIEGETAIATNQYDAHGNHIETTFASGVKEVKTYDSRARLTSITILDSDGVTLRSASYEYDAVGQILTETEGERRVEYEYDKFGQLIAWRTIESGSITKEVTLVYDAVGNNIRRVTNGSVTEARFDSTGQLVEEIENGVSTNYSYDANGNLVSTARDGVLQQRYTWNARGRLTLVENFENGVASGTTSYDYDRSGLLIRRVENGVSTTYAWDRSQRVANLISATRAGETEHFFHTDRILGRAAENGDLYFYHADPSLNVRAQSGPEQSLVFQADYAPFGEVLNETLTAEYDSAIVDFEFAGEIFDDFSGLTYLQQRYLDSELQRFISRDPFAGEIKLPLSQQPYQYALNNPLIFSDPTGEFGIPSLAELQAAMTIVKIVSAVGITQMLAANLGSNGSINFSGVLGGLDFNATPTVGIGLGFTYLLGGFGSDGPFVRDDKDTYSVSLGTGAGATISVGLGYSITGPFSASFGSASLDVPQNAVTRALRGSALSGAYAQLDVGYQAITGESPVAPLLIGFGFGDATGNSIGTNFGVGATATFGAYVSLSVAVEKGTADSVRNFASGFSRIPTLTSIISAIRRLL